MFVLTLAALLSLFLPISIKFELWVIRPFELIVMLSIIYTIISGYYKKISVTTGLMIFLPFVFWHVGSALALGFGNFLREALQMTVVLAFGIMVSSQLGNMNWRRLIIIISVGVTVITIYNVVWHISNNYYAGWKRLGDPKIIFSFLPIVFALFIHVVRIHSKTLEYGIWIIIAVVIALSGERKAMIIYALVGAIVLSRGRHIKAMSYAAILASTLMLAMSLSSNSYLQQQYLSIVEIIDDISENSVALIQEDTQPTSFSNSQRSFSVAVGIALWEKSPLFGIGTNAYDEIVASRYFFLPDYLTIGIHSEFLRVMVENGILGLFWYLCIWLTSIIRCRRVLRAALRTKALQRRQIGAFVTGLHLTFFVGAAFEASGTHALLIALFVALMPDGLETLLRRKSHPTPADAPRAQIRLTSAAHRREGDAMSIAGTT